MNEKEAVNTLGALAHEMRLGIIRLLVSRGSEGAPAGQIAEAIGAISSKASFHLANLERAGLIESERQSRKIVYRVNLDALGQVIAFILDDCCNGNPDIRACCELP